MEKSGFHADTHTQSGSALCIIHYTSRVTYALHFICPESNNVGGVATKGKRGAPSFSLSHITGVAQQFDLAACAEICVNFSEMSSSREKPRGSILSSRAGSAVDLTLFIHPVCFFMT
jgi:hypothetical protein